MKTKLFGLFIFCLLNALTAQNDRVESALKTIKYNSSIKSYNTAEHAVQFTYELDLKAYAVGLMGDLKVDIRSRGFKVYNISYRGYQPSDVGLSNSYENNKLQGDLRVKFHFKKPGERRGVYTGNYMNTSFGTSASGIDYVFLDNDVPAIKNHFGDYQTFKSTAQMFIDSAEITSWTFINFDYREFISLVDADIKKKERIAAKKEKINGLGEETIAELEKKKKEYLDLAEMDEDNDYAPEIAAIDEKIARLKEQEALAKQKQEAEENAKNDESETEEASENNDNGATSSSSKSNYDEEAAAEEQRNREAEAKRKAAEEKEERRRAWAKRVDEQNQRNQAAAVAGASAIITVAYMLGGIVYKNYGRFNPDKIYTDNNFYVGLDLGFTGSGIPTYFNSDYQQFEDSSTLTTESGYPVTLNFQPTLKVGYEYKYVGGYAFGRLEGGLFPLLTSYNLSYSYGGRLFAGHENIKLFGEYEMGQRSFSSNKWFDSQEFGGSKTKFDYANIKAGIRFSWRSEPDNPIRNHIYLGLIEERITGHDDTIEVQDNLKEHEREFSTNGETTYKKSLFFKKHPTYRGFMAEWKHDHHGKAFIQIYPNYPRTGELTSGLSDDLLEADRDGKGGLFIQIGFVRSFDWFSKF